MSNKRMIITNVLLIFFSFLAIGVISVFTLHKLIEKSNEELASITAEKLYNDIQAMTAKPVAIAETMANDYGFHKIINDDSDAEIFKYLSLIRNHFDCSTAFFANDKTHFYYTYDGQKFKLHEKESSWYFSLRNSQNILTTRIDKNDQQNGIPTVFINCKIFSSEGKFLGICGVAFKVKDVIEVFSEYKKLHDIDIYIMNDDGSIYLGTADNPEDETLKFALQFVNREGDYVYHKTRNNGYVLSKYLDRWHRQFVITRSKTSRNINSILVNYEVLTLVAAMAFLILTVSLHLYRQRKFFIEEAKSDGMTGLLNKTGFLKDSSDQLLSRHHENTAFAFIDLDNFKNVNDTLGHEMGDIAIKDAANVINSLVKTSGLMGRFGGDEFVLFLKNIDEANLRKLLASLVEKLKNDYSDGSHTVNVTSSIGAILIHDTGNLSIEEIMKKADQLLYEVKSGGKNGFALKVE